MSFFHYNIAKAIFAIKLKGTEYGRSEKSTVLQRNLRLLYIAIKVYIKVSKCKIRHTSFEIYRILAELSFRELLNACLFSFIQI